MGKEAIQATVEFVDVSWTRTIKKIDVEYETPQDLVEYATGFLKEGATHVSIGVDVVDRTAIVVPEWDYSKTNVRPIPLKLTKEGPYREGFKPIEL